MPKLSDKELNEIVLKVASPTFKFFMKRIQNEILYKHKNIEIVMFCSLFIAIKADIDANALRWLQNSLKLQSGKDLNIEEIRSIFNKRLDECLGTLLQ